MLNWQQTRFSSIKIRTVNYKLVATQTFEQWLSLFLLKMKIICSILTDKESKSKEQKLPPLGNNKNSICKNQTWSSCCHKKQDVQIQKRISQIIVMYCESIFIGGYQFSWFREKSSVCRFLNLWIWQLHHAN